MPCVVLPYYALLIGKIMLASKNNYINKQPLRVFQKRIITNLSAGFQKAHACLL